MNCHQTGTQQSFVQDLKAENILNLTFTHKLPCPLRSNYWSFLKFTMIGDNFIINVLIIIFDIKVFLEKTYEYTKLNWTLSHKWPWTLRPYYVCFCSIFAKTCYNFLMNRWIAFRLEQNKICDWQDLLRYQIKFDPDL